MHLIILELVLPDMDVVQPTHTCRLLHTVLPKELVGQTAAHGKKMESTV